jgi:transcriptional regulator with XRE-family HTH domain
VESQFAALLRRHRTAAHLTQDELSTASGVSVQAISTLERGTTPSSAPSQPSPTPCNWTPTSAPPW